MYLPDFDYHAPATLSEACGLLASLGEGARILAGGTDLLHKMKLGKEEPKALVSLRRLEELKAIRAVPGVGVVIGATATHNALMESEVLHSAFFSVSDAAHQMASNQIRNLGTVGGNIVNAAPSADLVPILIALKATIRLVSASGERTMELGDFFAEPASCVIAPGEILTEITIPEQRATGSRYVKFGLRRSGALAVVGAAAAVTCSGGKIEECRIALSSSAPKPIRAFEAEKFLVGREPTLANLKEAQKLVSAEVRPRDSIRGSADYRRHLAGVLARRALTKAVETGHGKGGAGCSH